MTKGFQSENAAFFAGHGGAGSAGAIDCGIGQAGITAPLGRFSEPTHQVAGNGAL